MDSAGDCKAKNVACVTVAYANEQHTNIDTTACTCGDDKCVVCKEKTKCKLCKSSVAYNAANNWEAPTGDTCAATNRKIYCANAIKIPCANACVVPAKNGGNCADAIFVENCLEYRLKVEGTSKINYAYQDYGENLKKVDWKCAKCKTTHYLKLSDGTCVVRDKSASSSCKTDNTDDDKCKECKDEFWKNN